MNVASGQFAYGRFHTRRQDGTLPAVPTEPLNDATAFISQRSVRAQGPPAEYGIFGKSHAVVVVWRHVSLRVLPRNQKDWLYPEGTWREQWVSDFRKKKPAVYGDLAFLTIGAGPSGFLFSGYLNADLNRHNDVKENAVDYESMRLAVDEQENAIRNVLTRTAAFQNDLLEYTLDPDPGDAKYNSNSFLRGLLEACHLSLFAFPVNDNGSSWRLPVGLSRFRLSTSALGLTKWVV